MCVVLCSCTHLHAHVFVCIYTHRFVLGRRGRELERERGGRREEERRGAGERGEWRGRGGEREREEGRGRERGGEQERGGSGRERGGRERERERERGGVGGCEEREGGRTGGKPCIIVVTQSHLVVATLIANRVSHNNWNISGCTLIVSLS